MPVINHEGQRENVDITVPGSITLTSDYDYDVHGNRVKESVKRVRSYANQADLITMLKNTTASYDNLQRIATFSDTRPNNKTIELKYYYDAVGNRRSIIGSNATDFAYWYTYDEANRVLISQGKRVEHVSGTNSIQLRPQQGRILHYAQGRLASVYSKSNGVYQWRGSTPRDNVDINQSIETTETYSYNANGELATIAYVQDRTGSGTIGNQHREEHTTRTYDHAGRLMKEQKISDNFIKENTIIYNDNGWQAQNQSTTRKKLSGEIVGNSLVRYFDGDALGYDGVGNVYGYRVTSGNTNDLGKLVIYSIDHYYNYRYFDDYQEAARLGKGISGIVVNGLLPGRSQSTYDSWGNRMEWIDFAVNNSQEEKINFYYDTDGKVLERRSLKRDPSEYHRPVLYYYYLNGQSLGSADSEFNKADFDNQFTPLTQMAPVPGQYTVNEGDTLESIARSMYGDAGLWYLIADANGFSASDDLLVGRLIKIPDAQGLVHNSADVFKPYNPSKILGDTSPTMPQAPISAVEGNKCAQALVIIVTIVVSVVLTPAGGAFLGGFVGSLFGQGVAMTAGIQEDVDIGQALVAGYTANLGQALGGAFGSSALGQFAQGAVGSVINQAINIGAGDQEDFSWGAVAAAGVVSMLFPNTTTDVNNNVRLDAGSGLANRFLTKGQLDFSKVVTEAGKSVVKGVISQTVRVAVDGEGEIDYVQIAANAFGDTLGNAMVAQANAPKTANPNGNRLPLQSPARDLGYSPVSTPLEKALGVSPWSRSSGAQRLMNNLTSSGYIGDLNANPNNYLLASTNSLSIGEALSHQKRDLNVVNELRRRKNQTPLLDTPDTRAALQIINLSDPKFDGEFGDIIFPYEGDVEFPFSETLDKAINSLNDDLTDKKSLMVIASGGSVTEQLAAVYNLIGSRATDQQMLGLLRSIRTINNNSDDYAGQPYILDVTDALLTSEAGAFQQEKYGLGTAIKTLETLDQFIDMTSRGDMLVDAPELINNRMTMAGAINTLRKVNFANDYGAPKNLRTSAKNSLLLDALLLLPEVAGAGVGAAKVVSRVVKRLANGVPFRLQFEIVDVKPRFRQAGSSGFRVKVVSNKTQVFPNQLSSALKEELAIARQLGVKPISVADEGFDAVANSGTIKWAVTEAGELKIIPKYVDDVELKHSVLTNGNPVLAAGEAEIAIGGGQKLGMVINRHTGHFQTSAESLQIGLDAFKKYGIEFFDVVKTLP